VLFALAFKTSLLIFHLTISSEHQLSKYDDANYTPEQSRIRRGQHLQATINEIGTSRFGLGVEFIILLTYVAKLLLLTGYTLLIFTLDGFTSVILKHLVLSLDSYVFTAMLSPGSRFRVTVTLVSRLLLFRSRRFQQRFNHILGGSRVNNEERLNGQPLLATANRLPDQWTAWDSHASAADSITWMIAKAADTEAIASFVTAVVWHSGIQTTPMIALYDLLFRCFDRRSGHPVLIPAHRDKAYICAKALFHVAIQRKCFGNDSDGMAFGSISGRHSIVGYQGDPELASVLGVIDIIFQPNNPQPVPWGTFTFTAAHHAWMGHILLYYAWDSTRTQITFPREIVEFVDHSLQLETPPPAPIIVDCILIIGLFLGIQLDLDDLSVPDKR